MEGFHKGNFHHIREAPSGKKQNWFGFLLGLIYKLDKKGLGTQGS